MKIKNFYFLLPLFITITLSACGVNKNDNPNVSSSQSSELSFDEKIDNRMAVVLTNNFDLVKEEFNKYKGNLVPSYSRKNHPRVIKIIILSENQLTSDELQMIIDESTKKLYNKTGYYIPMLFNLSNGTSIADNSYWKNEISKVNPNAIIENALYSSDITSKPTESTSKVETSSTNSVDNKQNSYETGGAVKNNLSSYIITDYSIKAPKNIMGTFYLMKDRNIPKNFATVTSETAIIETNGEQVSNSHNIDISLTIRNSSSQFLVIDISKFTLESPQISQEMEVYSPYNLVLQPETAVVVQKAFTNISDQHLVEGWDISYDGSDNTILTAPSGSAGFTDTLSMD